STMAFFNRGLARKESGDWDGAMDDYTRAIELDPKYVVAFNNRGNVWWEMGELEKAIADYSKAVVLNPKHVSSLTNRALAYSELEMYELSLIDLRQAYDLQPTGGRAYLGAKLAADAYSSLKESEPKDPEKARLLDESFDWIEKAIQLRSQNLLRLSTNKNFKPLHEDPRWKEVLQKIEALKLEPKKSSRE
ncbi:MAG: tetratricopeptide repeat protein, partial [Planctomycetes bacterium]|nr:tetratricopeptide repeat protein [Planctomycetota bacterium]